MHVGEDVDDRDGGAAWDASGIHTFAFVPLRACAIGSAGVTLGRTRRTDLFDAGSASNRVSRAAYRFLIASNRLQQARTPQPSTLP
jgi:hypothetical protein